ncbi:TPA: conjugal transfer protein TraM [Legionella pneumophila]|uniref:Conjugal transfer protein TraM n=1 Tax=Legionella lytica TaxID=96232 RepID=A0ABY4YAV2_9GAMM|nr:MULTISPECIES: conjugal transfer protein TraM [Legionella]HAT9660773.1 conjugal transfer protein TraM [Legionella pneumophila subsp. pneumophila]RUR13485.1 conjugal transfer protein TraM [Legionella septentrionalis]USQ14498.1 conjugal transfer protein TraM [Legionella lytica]GAN31441.1 transcriptional activator TraM [Legionella pneumophila]HCJ1125092.1 conjugal transfer protein TraM [Legionella pneumophila]
MSEKLDKIVQDIAVKHGVLLGKDDPILMLQTMNEQLIEENRKAQQDLLRLFQEEMEDISSRWKDDAKEKSEKVLNAALASSKEAITRLLHESTKESVQTIKKLISDSLNEAQFLTQRTQKFSRVALVSSATFFIASCMIFLFCTKML